MSATLDTLKEKARKLRIHSLKATTEAGSGHPSSCLSAADLVSALFFHEMQFDPQDPGNPANDRFVLSKGHAAPLLWAAYAEAGYVAEARLLTLRRFDSDLEGHPTPRFPWVDVATGSLGQGLSAALGCALAARIDGLPYNTYALLGDGECAEGSVWEAAALAAHYKVRNLVALVDVNGMGQSQHTMDRFDTDRFAAKFRSFGWFAVTVDGHDMEAILDALEACRREGGDRPRAIVAKTFKGKGVKMLENLEGWHGKPVPRKDLESALGDLATPFPSDGFRPAIRSRPRNVGTLPDLTISIARKTGDLVATREAYGDALVKLVARDPRIIAIDGDTKNSTFSEKLLRDHAGRFLEMFIAEQNMVGVAMGLAARGKIPFVSTFAAFLTRAFDQIRMAGVSRLNIKFVGSHCGVSIGEDGPSQMGLEDLAMFRAVPGSVVLYPCDGVSAEYLAAEAARTNGIVYLRTTRPKAPVIYPADEQFPVGGSKTVRRSANDVATVVAAGITLHEAVKASVQLETERKPIRIIDAYSVKPIDAAGILDAVRGTGGRLIVAEDHYFDGGLGDAVLNAVNGECRVHKLAVCGVPRSGTPDELVDAFGISAAHIAETVRRLVRGGP